MYGKALFTGGPDGPQTADVRQGKVSNCYFSGAMGGLARHAPHALRTAISYEGDLRTKGDGIYTVTFKERDEETNRWRETKVQVDGELYVRANGEPLFGHSPGASDSKK